MTNVPANLLKSVCEKNFLGATFNQHSSIFITTHMKYVQNIFRGKFLFAPSFLVCTHLTIFVHAKCAQLKRTLVMTYIIWMLVTVVMVSYRTSLETFIRDCLAGLETLNLWKFMITTYS